VHLDPHLSGPYRGGSAPVRLGPCGVTRPRVGTAEPAMAGSAAKQELRPRFRSNPPSCQQERRTPQHRRHPRPAETPGRARHPHRATSWDSGLSSLTAARRTGPVSRVDEFPGVPSQRIWSGGRAVICGDRFVRDALRGGFSGDVVRRSWMPNLVSVDLARPLLLWAVPDLLPAHELKADEESNGRSD
jgi:hypothetical protein